MVIPGNLVVERKRNDSRFGRITEDTGGLQEVAGIAELIVAEGHG